MKETSLPEGDAVIVERRGNIAIVTLNVAEQNKSSAHERLHALHTTLTGLDAQDGRCGAIVLAAVSADGFNFGENGSQERGPDRPCASNSDTLALRVFRLIVAGRRPVIAVVEGMASGAGLSLIAACDYVVADSTSCFDLFFWRRSVA